MGEVIEGIDDDYHPIEDEGWSEHQFIIRGGTMVYMGNLWAMARDEFLSCMRYGDEDGSVMGMSGACLAGYGIPPQFAVFFYDRPYQKTMEGKHGSIDFGTAEDLDRARSICEHGQALDNLADDVGVENSLRYGTALVKRLNKIHKAYNSVAWITGNDTTRMDLEHGVDDWFRQELKTIGRESGAILEEE